MPSFTSEGFDAAVAFAGGNKARLAKLLNLTRAAVNQWGGIIPPKWAVEIEEKSHGKLTRWQLRPDYFGPPAKRRRSA